MPVSFHLAQERVVVVVVVVVVPSELVRRVRD